MDVSCSEGPVTSRNKLALTVMDLPQTENVHNTALGAHGRLGTGDSVKPDSNHLKPPPRMRHAHGG